MRFHEEDTIESRETAPEKQTVSKEKICNLPLVKDLPCFGHFFERTHKIRIRGHFLNTRTARSIVIVPRGRTPFWLMGSLFG